MNSGRPGVHGRRKAAWWLCFAVALVWLGLPAFGASAQVGGPSQPGKGGLGIGAPTTSRITTENALPGTDDWANIGNYDMSNLSAYAGATSVNAGGSINIHVRASGGSVTGTLYRLGYYQNHGARYIATYANKPVSTQPACTRNSGIGLVTCPWSPTFSIATDPTWISGIFLLRLDSSNGYRFFVYFTVRNDAYNSDIIVTEASKTNQAYNSYGCESLYVSQTPSSANNNCNGVPSNGNNGRRRAYQVSFDRPYYGGAGTGGLFVHDVEMVRWLEASGYDVSYISDVDRAANPSILLNHRVYLDMGHDEYWTWGERDSVENAVAQGVNVIFASGNESGWRIRMADSNGNPTTRIITCYKDAALDPVQSGPDGPTITFRDLNRPENSLVGTGYQSYYDDVLYNAPWVASVTPGKWYFDCTGLQTGDTINNIVGEEWNAILPNGATPPNLDILSNGTVISQRGETLPQNSSYYTAASGAGVFAAGSIHWSWGLIDHSYANQIFQPAYTSNDADQRIEQLTANFIDRFAGYWDGQPRDCNSQSFYKVGPRPTRTPRPVPPTATGTPATPTRTPASTYTPTRIATITPTAGAGCTLTFNSTDVPKSIPDQGVVTSTLAVNNAGTIADVAVTGMVLRHTYASDLSAFLISPQGTRVELFTHVCGSDNWTTGSTGFTLSSSGSAVIGTTCPPGQATYRPEGDLSPLVGGQAQGTWKLEVSDDGPSDIGTVDAWGLRITYSGGGSCVGPTSTPTSTTVASNTPTRTYTATPTRTATQQPTATNTQAVATNTRVPATNTAAPSATPTSTQQPASTATRTATPRPATATPTGTPATGQACALTYTSVDVPKPIIDQGTSFSSLTVNDSGTVGRVEVRNLAIQHTYASDVSAWLISPQGTRLMLFSHKCGSGVWTAANTGFGFSQTGSALLGSACPPRQTVYLPVDSFSALVGQQARGTWKLEVNDGGPYDTGSVNAWSLRITYSDPICPINPAAPTATPPPATRTPNATFDDVPPTNAFRGYLQWMASRGYISGYPCGGPGEPCPGTYFRPGNNVGRGQLLKMVVSASGWDMDNPREATFVDVPRGSPFYIYIQTAVEHNIVGGYPCGSPGEPCNENNQPYFRPGNNVTRGQLSKVLSLALSLPGPAGGSTTFGDVPLDNPFYQYIEAMAANNVVAGYACGAAGEPCDAQNRPYFRPTLPATRGQVAKFVAVSYGYTP